MCNPNQIRISRNISKTKLNEKKKKKYFGWTENEIQRPRHTHTHAHTVQNVRFTYARRRRRRLRRCWEHWRSGDPSLPHYLLLISIGIFANGGDKQRKTKRGVVSSPSLSSPPSPPPLPSSPSSPSSRIIIRHDDAIRSHIRTKLRRDVNLLKRTQAEDKKKREEKEEQKKKTIRNVRQKATENNNKNLHKIYFE